MPIALAKAKLIDDVLKGNVTSAVALARREGCQTVRDLIRVVDPKMRPSVALCDVCADGIALLREMASRAERPTVELPTPKEGF